jgi:hypothetical protein
VQKLCLQCGSVGATKRFMKGSIVTELFLWLFFLLPGLIYSIWRHASVAQVCTKCGSSNVIPLDSPIAKNLLATQLKSSIPSPVAPSVRPPQAQMTPKKALAIVGGFAVLLVVLFVSMMGGAKGQPSEENSARPVAVTAPVPAAASSTPAYSGGEAARIIAMCGKPYEDFTKEEGGQPARHLIYKKQKVELIYSRWNVPAWELVGIFEPNRDGTIETALANRRLPCAAGTIRTVLDKPR